MYYERGNWFWAGCGRALVPVGIFILYVLVRFLFGI